MKKIRTLLLDDDQYIRIGIKQSIQDFCLIDEAASLKEASGLIRSGVYELLILDMHLTDGLGSQLLDLNKHNDAHIIMLSSLDCAQKIEEAYSKGCHHYLAKQGYARHLPQYIQSYINAKKQTQCNFKTKDKGMLEFIERVRTSQLRGQTILLTGETGVGKTLIGKYIHQANHPDKAPMVHLNCSEFAAGTIESELFGHKKGSFTGATCDKIGKLEAANGGTLFLDEIATMSLATQQKLLNAIEEKSFYPLGSNSPVKVEFTLVAATCEDLFEKIANGSFRKDFYYRISGINHCIPPLRDRREDIDFLICDFLSKQNRRVVLRADAKEALINHDWEGNTRELRKVLSLICLMDKGVAHANDVRPLLKGLAHKTAKSSFSGDDLMKMIDQDGLKSLISYIEQEAVKRSLEKHQGKITAVIKELKLSSSAFYRIFNTLKA